MLSRFSRIPVILAVTLALTAVATTALGVGPEPSSASLPGSRDLLVSLQGFFTGALGAFAVLHYLLYVFNREAHQHLHFAILTASASAAAYLLAEARLTADPAFLLFFNRWMNVVALVALLSLLGFLYSVFQPQMPRRWYVAMGLGCGLLVLNFTLQRWATLGLFALGLAASAETLRVVAQALWRRQAGARVIGLGMLVYALGLACALLAGLGYLSDSLATLYLTPFLATLVLALTMSVYLSTTVAHTNRRLAEQLEEVRRLSEERLRQERQAAEERTRRRLLEAENERQARELEEARRLQLSMLPSELPVHEDLEIAAVMRTATEVGGDYYDLDLQADGTLTVAVGDATGHGLRAGTLVSATKSLFQALGREPGLRSILEKANRALKGMRLRKLQMALMLVRIERGRLCLASAGMPPLFCYRASKGEVESVLIGGMPLGALASFPYRERTLELAAGDTVLLMSDGFPELASPAGEQLGYERVSQLFREAGGRPAVEVVEHLLRAAERWADGRAAEDDLTFVVLRRRLPLEAAVQKVDRASG